MKEEDLQKQFTLIETVFSTFCIKAFKIFIIYDLLSCVAVLLRT